MKIFSNQVASVALFLAMSFFQLMVAHSAPSSGRVALVMDPASPRARMIKNLSLDFRPVAGMPSALDVSRYHLAIIDATPANLQSLKDQAKELGAFTSHGGWIMLWGLTPDGLTDFNQLVGVDHLIRPFRMEKVAMPATPDSLVSGLTDEDFHLESNKQTPQPGAVNFLANDAFSYVVDFDDIAPFCELPSAAYWGRPDAMLGWDNWPPNLVNGIDDYWRFGFTIPLSKPEYSKWTMKLPREEEIIGFSLVRDPLYSRITKVHLSSSNQPPVNLDVTKDNARQDFTFPGFRATNLDIAIDHDQGKPPSAGLENLWIKVKRSSEFYAKVKPLASIGVLVAYPQGSGGIVLNQLAIPDSEAVAANAEKKQTILQVLFANLGASFTSGGGKHDRKVEWLQKGTAWEDPANWSGGKVPGPDDLAVFPVPENYMAKVNPILNTALAVKGLRFYNGLGGPRIHYVYSDPSASPLAPGVKKLRQPDPSWVIGGTGELSIGTGGIVVDGQGGTDIIQPAAKLTGPQTWLVGGDSSSALMGLNDFYGNPTDLVFCGPLSGTGGIIKKGTGRVYYANNTAPTFTGGLTVQGYSLEWALTNLQTGGKFRFGSDPITLDGGYFCFGASDTDQKTVTEENNPILITDKGGMIEYSIEGKPERLPLITYSGPITLGGLLKLAHSTIGWSNSGLEIAGPITLDQENYSTLAIVSGDFSTGWTIPPKVTGSIHDGTGESGNPLILRSFMNNFSFTGIQNDYAGPTVIDMCGDVTWGGAEDATVSFGSNTTIGRGNLDLLPGARAQLSSPQNLSANATISFTSNPADLSVITIGFNQLPLITKDSSGGVLCLEVPVFDAVKDMSTIGDGTLRLSSVHGGIFSGDTLRPGAGNRYRFGGGIVYGAAALTIEHGVLTGSAGVEMGSTAWWGNGNLVLKGANSFSGPLVLQGFTMTDNGSYSSSLDGIAQTGANDSPFGAADGDVILHTSVLELTGVAGGQAVSKRLLTFEGNPTITLDGSAGPAHLNVEDIKRIDRSVLTINAVKDHLGEEEQFQVTGWSNHSGMQPPYLVYEQDASHLDFLSYDGKNQTGFHRLSDYVTDWKKVGPSDALEIGATQLNGEILTVGALKTTGPITGSGTIHITGGGLLAGGDIAPNIDFGHAEGIIHGWPALKGKVSGTNGLTFSTSFCASEISVHTTSLSNSANDFTGTITIEGLRVDVGYDVFDSDGRAQLGSLGNLANNIVLNGGGLVFSKPLATTDEKIGLAASRTVTLGPSGGLINSPVGPVHLAARVTGPGMLTEPGELSGPLIIENPDNDYTGGTRLLLGGEAMTVTSTGKLGKGPVEVDAESWLNLEGDHNIDSHACLHTTQESMVTFFSKAPEIGSLIGGGLISLSGADTNLSVGSDDTSFTFYGSIKEQTNAAKPGLGSLTKVGMGAWTLYGNHSYSGLTTVAAGTLILKGGVRGDVNVPEHGTLAGSGIIGGNLSVRGGRVSPEISAAGLRIKGNARLDAASSFHVVLSKDKAGELNVGGQITLNGSLVINASDTPSAPGSKWKLLTAGGGIQGKFIELPAGYEVHLSSDEKVLELIKVQP